MTVRRRRNFEFQEWNRPFSLSREHRSEILEMLKDAQVDSAIIRRVESERESVIGFVTVPGSDKFETVVAYGKELKVNRGRTAQVREVKTQGDLVFFSRLERACQDVDMALNPGEIAQGEGRRNSKNTSPSPAEVRAALDHLAKVDDANLEASIEELDAVTRGVVLARIQEHIWLTTDKVVEDDAELMAVLRDDEAARRIAFRKIRVKNPEGGRPRQGIDSTRLEEFAYRVGRILAEYGIPIHTGRDGRSPSVRRLSAASTKFRGESRPYKKGAFYRILDLLRFASKTQARRLQTDLTKHMASAINRLENETILPA